MPENTRVTTSSLVGNVGRTCNHSRRRARQPRVHRRALTYGVWRPPRYRGHMEKTTIYLTDELRQALERHLRRTGRRQSDVVREALGVYLADRDPGLPTSIGVADDGSLDPADDERELVRAWGSVETDATEEGGATAPDAVPGGDAATNQPGRE